MLRAAAIFDRNEGDAAMSAAQRHSGRGAERIHIELRRTGIEKSIAELLAVSA
jgi:hypothetical protein